MAKPTQTAIKSSFDDIKQPPHSTEAEQAVIGGLLLDTSVWDGLADLISEKDFFGFEHR